MAPLEFDTTLSGAGDALIALTGELDLSGAPALDQEIEELSRRPEVQRVVLDLRRLAFLALAERRLSAGGRSLVLVRGDENVQRVFEITRMVERLEFVDDPQANGSGS